MPNHDQTETTMTVDDFDQTTPPTPAIQPSTGEQPSVPGAEPGDAQWPSEGVVAPDDAHLHEIWVRAVESRAKPWPLAGWRALWLDGYGTAIAEEVEDGKFVACACDPRGERCEWHQAHPTGTHPLGPPAAAAGGDAGKVEHPATEFNQNAESLNSVGAAGGDDQVPELIPALTAELERIDNEHQVPTMTPEALAAALEPFVMARLGDAYGDGWSAAAAVTAAGERNVEIGRLRDELESMQAGYEGLEQGFSSDRDRADKLAALAEQVIAHCHCDHKLSFRDRLVRLRTAGQDVAPEDELGPDPNYAAEDAAQAEVHGDAAGQGQADGD